MLLNLLGHAALGAQSTQEAEPAKALPRLLAPRASIAETVAANRAASQTAARNALADQIKEHEGQEEGGVETCSNQDIIVSCSWIVESANGSFTTQILQIMLQNIANLHGTCTTELFYSACSYWLRISELQETEPLDARKRKHSALGHLWKVVKNDFLNPKAAAADIQAISLSAASMSVSAAKQAGSAMNSMATKMESEVSNLHDQILGGKRNLPDHSRELDNPDLCFPCQTNIFVSTNYMCIFLSQYIALSGC